MTDRIIFTAIPSRPGVARVCADECRIKLYDLSTQTLRTDQITVRSAYQIFQKNTRTGDDKISFDTFHHLMDDMFRKYGTATGGKTHLYRRVVQKLYQAVDVSNEGSLTPIQLTCGMSLLFRPEAGISGVDVDSTSPIVEDCLRILCPDGIVTFEKLNEYFTLLFSVFISMSPDLSKVFPAAAAEEEEDTDEGSEIQEVAPPSAQDLEDESMRLARQLMEEEQANFYERLEREQAAAIERMRQDDLASGGAVGADLQFALRLAVDEDVVEEEGGDDVNPDDMTYDQLLDLGERLGNVAQERWRVEGREAVSALRVIKYVSGSCTDTKDTKCLVCQYDFEDGESLKILPCSHAFHVECIDGWLESHKTCVTCKRSILQTDTTNADDA